MEVGNKVYMYQNEWKLEKREILWNSRVHITVYQGINMENVLYLLITALFDISKYLHQIPPDCLLCHHRFHLVYHYTNK